MANRLTEEIIEDGMAWAERVAFRPGDDRCLTLPDGVARSRVTCSPKDRWMIGGTYRVIVANSGHESWDVWLDVHTSEGEVTAPAR